MGGFPAKIDQSLVFPLCCGVTEGNSRVTGIAGLISILEQAVIAKGIKWPLYEHQRFFCNATKIIAI